MIRLTLFLVLCVAAQSAAAQSFESLLCKTWKARYFEEGGRKKYPDDSEANDRITFYHGNTAEFIEAGESQDGLWQYNASNKRLVFSNRVSKEKMTMQVISLTKDELVLKFLEDDEGSQVVHLVPVAK